MSMSKEPVILIDVMNTVFRSHFAFQNLQNEGHHTGVQYGVLKTIDQLRTNVSKRLVFVWDHGIPVLGAERPRNWREDLVPTYKANRKRDKDLTRIVFSQLLDLADMITCLGYTNLGIMGLEADDVIGLLSRHYDSVAIFSTDCDYYQLLNKNVRIVVPKKDKKTYRFITRSDVETENGISMDRWAEYLALGGDKSDNIKPMRGMGPKTAIKLIQAGADLRGNLTFDEQKQDFRQGFEKYRECWLEILKSYHASQIPTSMQDSRITDCLKMHGSKTFPIPEQHWKDDRHYRDSYNKFVQFLADRNMVSLLGIRQRFFTKESICQTPITTIKDASQRHSFL
jgi:5'-3' exonuclease